MRPEQAIDDYLGDRRAIENTIEVKCEHCGHSNHYMNIKCEECGEGVENDECS